MSLENAVLSESSHPYKANPMWYKVSQFTEMEKRKLLTLAGEAGSWEMLSNGQRPKAGKVGQQKPL